MISSTVFFSINPFSEIFQLENKGSTSNHHMKHMTWQTDTLEDALYLQEQINSGKMIILLNRKIHFNSSRRFQVFRHEWPWRKTPEDCW